MTNTHASQFKVLARSGDPPFDRMLLALAEEFHPVDGGAALEQLDEMARPLFGIATMEGRAAGELIATELGKQLRARDDPTGAADLFLDQVLQGRRGHAALVAAAYVEIARRAGVSLTLLSSPEAWFAAIVGEEGAVLVDPAGSTDALQPNLTLRRHCAHGLAHSVLCALTGRFRALGSAGQARRALELRLELPLGEELLARARTELRQLDREGC
jgi:Transglutaminase-like superfamily